LHGAEKFPTAKINETWLPVVGYEGAYEVSDQGRVRGVDRVLDRTVARPGRRGGSPIQPWKGKVLRATRRLRDGHLVVNLCKSGRPKAAYVHQIVLAAFVGPCPTGLEVAHGNGDASDNRFANLRYDTHKNNEAGTRLLANEKVAVALKKFYDDHPGHAARREAALRSPKTQARRLASFLATIANRRAEKEAALRESGAKNKKDRPASS
jgi:hypothetical protein